MRVLVVYCGVTEIATVFHPEVCVGVCARVCRCVSPPPLRHLLKDKKKNSGKTKKMKKKKKRSALIRLVRASVQVFFSSFSSSARCSADYKRTSDN